MSPTRSIPASRLRRRTDAWLTRRARRDDEAYAALLERHAADLYRTCWAVLRDEHDAGDALQQTHLAALRALRAGSRPRAPRAWLHGIARHESIDLSRGRSRARRAQAAAAQPPTVPAADVEHARGQDLRDVLADVARLPEAQREALLLREASGLRPEEIGRVLGVASGAVRQRVRAARVALMQEREGRTAPCAEIRETLADPRRRRSRRVGAHVRACAACRAQLEREATRRSAVRGVAPALPLAAFAADALRTAAGSGAAATEPAAGVLLSGAGASGSGIGAGGGLGAGAGSGVAAGGVGSGLSGSVGLGTTAGGLATAGAGGVPGLAVLAAAVVGAGGLAVGGIGPPAPTPPAAAAGDASASAPSGAGDLARGEAARASGRGPSGPGRGGAAAGRGTAAASRAEAAERGAGRGDGERGRGRGRGPDGRPTRRGAAGSSSGAGSASGRAPASRASTGASARGARGGSQVVGPGAAPVAAAGGGDAPSRASAGRAADPGTSGASSTSAGRGSRPAPASGGSSSQVGGSDGREAAATPRAGTPVTAGGER